MISRNCVAAVAICLAASSMATPAIAAVSAIDRCNEVRRKLDTSFWNELRNAADKSVCRRPWSERGIAEFAACASTDFTGKLGTYLKDGLNAFFSRNNAEWATLGPRYVGSNEERGTIRGGFKRTFLGVGLPYVDTKVTVEKSDGRAEGIVTVCQIAEVNNRILETRRHVFANGNNNIGQDYQVTLSNSELAIVAVVVDTPASVNSFSYETRMQDIGGLGGPKANGIADLHLHQLADYGFGGRMLMGEHRGPKSSALAPDQLSLGSENLVKMAGSISLNRAIPPTPVGAVIAAILPSGLGIDANIIVTAQALPTGKFATTMLAGNNSEGLTSFAVRDEDGFFQVAMPGGGSPGFQRWPHHADRMHQQAHIDWLKAAHDRGLNLIVLSAVHSPFLCNLMTKLDPYGNVGETRDGNGRITRWKSQNWNCDTKTTINREIDAAQALDRELDWYEIVMSPKHARHVISEGKLAVVLSIESDGVLNTELGEGDFEDELLRLRMRGVSTLQIVHERDSRFCGAALHRDEMRNLQWLRYGLQEAITNPTSIYGGLANPERDGSPFSLDAAGRNRIGLKADGVAVVNLMMDQGMPIDIAHMSVACRRDVFAHIEQRSETYGLYDSHTKFERMINPELPGNREVRAQTGFVPAAFEREKEFMITQDLLPSYKRHNVLLGLRTGPVDIYDAPARKDGKPGVPNTCPGSARTFAQLVDFATDQGLPIAFGSDINGLIAQLGPRLGPKRCYAANVPGGNPARAADEQTELGKQLQTFNGVAEQRPEQLRPPIARQSSAAAPVLTGQLGGKPMGAASLAQRPVGPGQLAEPKPTSTVAGSQLKSPASGATAATAAALAAMQDKTAVLRPIAPPREVPDIDGTNYYRDGLASVAWLPEVYEDLKTLRTPGVEDLGDSAEAYIQMWEKAWAKRR